MASLYMPEPKEDAPYLFYMAFMLLFCSLIFAIPLLQMQKTPLSGYAYSAFSYTCHQLNARSLCIFERGGNFALEDCANEGENGIHAIHERTAEVEKNGEIGYKLPVCARDIGIYFGMLLGGFLLPFLLGVKRTEIPNKWLFVIALIPMALDGGTQLIGLRESTNFLRIITGAIVGVAMPFYIIPILNELTGGLFANKRGSSK